MLEFADLRRILRTKREDDDFKLAVDDPWTHEKIRDAKEDEDEDDDNYYSLYRR